MTQSEQLFEDAKKILVGGVNSPVRAFNAVGGTPVMMQKGQGSKLIDVDGKSYIDYVLSWGPLLFGHSDEDILESLITAAKGGTSFGTSCTQEIILANLIQSFYPSVDKVRFVNSGTEATMSAIRLARGATGKSKILKFNGCYHGHSDGLLIGAGSGPLSLGIPGSKGVLDDFTKHTLSCDFNDFEAVEQIFNEYGDDIAAIIIEPVAGNMGLVLPQDDFLQNLRDITTTHNSILIFDEVMCGFRVAPGGAQEVYGVKPDITCFGKVIGGGLPCGAYGGRADIMDQLSPLGDVYQAGTLSGNHLAMSVGIAMLQKLGDGKSFDLAKTQTTKLVSGFKSVLKDQNLSYTVESLGTEFCVFFEDTERYKTYFHSMLDQGIYLAPSSFETGFVSSAHSDADINQTIEAFSASLSKIKNQG